MECNNNIYRDIIKIISCNCNKTILEFLRVKFEEILELMQSCIIMKYSLHE